MLGKDLHQRKLRQMVMSYPNHQFPEMAERLANSDNNYTILVAEKWSFNDTTKKSTYWLRQIKYEKQCRRLSE